MLDSYSSITNPLDRDKINDLLMNQKHLTDEYNTFTNEASNKGLYMDLMSILSSEHEMEHKLFEEMQKRGWYAIDYAAESQIERTRQGVNQIK